MDNDDNKLINKLKNSIKIVIKTLVGIAIRILLPVIIIIVILAGAVYFITIDDGTYKEDDWGSVPFASSQYTGNTSISSDGKITSSNTPQEIWDKSKEEDGRANLYLDNAEQLAKLMNAEVVTQFLDTRANPDEPIDWDSINKPDSNELQGIIKLKRANSEGNTTTMTYMDPKEFQALIEDYNKSGDESKKKEALSHFTLEQEDESASDDSDSNIGIIKGKGTFTQYTDLTDTQIKAIANLCKQEQGSPKGAAAEASLMANRFELVGSRFGTGGAGLYNYVRTSGWFANAASHMDNGNASKEYIDAVKGVLVNGKRTLPKYVDEHDCFSDISRATNKGQAINVNNRSEYNQYVTKMNNRYGARYTFFCFPTDTSDPFGYTSKKSRKKYGDAYYDFDTGNLINGTDEQQSESESSDNSSDSENESEETVTAKYYAKVATWKETTDKVKTNDPEVQSTYGITTDTEEKVINQQFTMETTIINYQDFVSGYTMPFDYLWALLVIGEDKDFVLQLADLVYGSEIEITVHDNLTINTNIKEDTYTKETRTDTEGQVTVTYGNQFNMQNDTQKDSWSDSDQNTYTTKTTNIEKENKLDIDLTRANVWIVDYIQEYIYIKPESITVPNDKKIEDEEFKDSPDSHTNEDKYGHVNKLLQDTIAKHSTTTLGDMNNQQNNLNNNENSDEGNIQSTMVFNSQIDNIDTKIYNRIINRTIKTTNTTETSQYVSSPAKIIEKTDKNAEEDNFVTILLKDECKKAKKLILEVPSWLYEILESNKKTENMVDLTKYLLYKATNKDYGVKEYDFSAYDPEKFVSVSDNSELSGNSVEEKVWFALIDKGFSEYATAGVMGNIYGESGFNANLVEVGYNENNGGIGLCQWTNSGRGSTGRNTNLKKYAQSKGTTWKDEVIQIQFLLTELTGNGDAKGYAGKAFISNSMYGRKYSESDWKNATNIEDATKAFCATFERPGKEYFNSSMPKRTKAAQDYYNKYHGKEKPSSISSSSESGGNQAIVSTAKSKIGCPYEWGAKGPNSFDCSGFVYWVYKQHGITVPSYTDGYMSYRGTNKEISWSEAQPGDILIICKDEGDRPKYGCGHAGIYLGGDKYIHAPSSGKTVTIVDSGAKTKFKHVFRWSK